MEWQPIETAPMGVPILVYLPSGDADGNSFSVWPAIISDYDEPDFSSDGSGDKIGWIDIAVYSQSYDVGYAAGNARPTHWMPFPDPPTI